MTVLLYKHESVCPDFTIKCLLKSFHAHYGTVKSHLESLPSLALRVLRVCESSKSWLA